MQFASPDPEDEEGYGYRHRRGHEHGCESSTLYLYGFVVLSQLGPGGWLRFILVRTQMDFHNCTVVSMEVIFLFALVLYWMFFQYARQLKAMDAWEIATIRTERVVADAPGLYR